MFNLNVKPTENDKFVLQEPYTFGGVTIPKGYETNGADVPLFATLIIPRYLPSNLPMVAMHDYLTDLGQYEKADNMFEGMFRADEWTRRRALAVKAVRLYHRFKYGVK